MASRSEDAGGTAMVRQSSSSSCASSRSSLSNLGAAGLAGAGGPPNAPYLTVMKTQLNFFMTRLLFMQEEKADSLGARRDRRMNTSGNLNGSFNNSASRNMDAQQQQQHAEDAGNLLGPMMEPDELSTGDDICVFNDNARILPNSVAKSFPAVPFPPTAPESPRPVEGKEGIIVVTPTHQPASPRATSTNGDTKMAAAPSLPDALPLSISDMALEDTDTDVDVPFVEDDDEDDSDEQPPLEAVVVGDAVMQDHGGATSGSEPESSPKPLRGRNSVAAVAPGARVFPKNQRRSKRYSSRDAVRRSQSDVTDSDDGGLPDSAH